MKEIGIMGIRIEHPSIGALRPEHIKRLLQICDDEGVYLGEVLGHRRLASIVRARGRIAFVLRDEAKLSYPEIARILGRDNSTVMQAVRTTASRLGLVDNWEAA